MPNLTLWEPFADMAIMNSVLFDVLEDSEGYTVQATLPGVQPDQLEINFADQVLTVKGECKVPELAKEARYHLRERPVGKFERSFRFPLALNSEAAQANYEHGILTLRLPKAETLKPRRIEVNVG